MSLIWLAKKGQYSSLWPQLLSIKFWQGGKKRLFSPECKQKIRDLAEIYLYSREPIVLNSYLSPTIKCKKLIIKGLQGMSCKEQLRTLGLLNLEKRRSRGDLIALYNFLKRGSGEREVLIFSTWYLLGRCKWMAQGCVAEVQTRHLEKLVYQEGSWMWEQVS